MAFISGGNRYNLSLLGALRNLGAHVSHGPFNPDILLASTDTAYILDSLYFDQIDDVSVIPHFCVGLIHHLSSLYPNDVRHFEVHEKPVLDACKGFVVTSSYTRDYLITKGYSAQRMAVIEPAIEAIEPSSSSSSKLNALILANLIPRKGILPFLEALIELKCQPDYTLRIIGSPDADPVYAARCSEIIRDDAMLIKTVRLLGQQDDATVNKLMQQSNLFVSTSHFETFGMAIQEAATRKIPLLVCAGGHASAHVTEGINGWIVPDPASCAHQFCALAQSPEILRAMHHSSRDFKPEYNTSWGVAAIALLTFIERLKDHTTAPIT